MTVKNTPHLYEISYIQLATLTVNKYKTFKMFKTAIILPGLMEEKSRKFLFGSGSLQDGGGGEKKKSDFSTCSHPAASIISSLNRERAVPLVFLSAEGISSSWLERIVPCKLLLAAAKSAQRLLCGAGWGTMTHFTAAAPASPKMHKTPAPSLSSSLSAGKTSWSFYTPKYWGLFMLEFQD